MAASCRWPTRFWSTSSGWRSSRRPCAACRRSAARCSSAGTCDGQSRRKIADDLDLNLETVKKHLVRAMAELAGVMDAATGDAADWKGRLVSANDNDLSVMEEAADWIDRLDELSDAERGELAAWLNTSPRARGGLRQRCATPCATPPCWRPSIAFAPSPAEIARASPRRRAVPGGWSRAGLIAAGLLVAGRRRRPGRAPDRRARRAADRAGHGGGRAGRPRAQRRLDRPAQRRQPRQRRLQPDRPRHPSAPGRRRVRGRQESATGLST